MAKISRLNEVSASYGSELKLSERIMNNFLLQGNFSASHGCCIQATHPGVSSQHLSSPC